MVKCFMARIQIFNLLLCFFWTTTSTSQSLLYLPLDHWAYPYLDRFVGLNLIQLDLEVRPIPRGEIVEALRPLLGSIEREEVNLSDVDQWYVEKLMVEFQRELEIHPKKIADRPLLEFEDGDRYFTLDTRLAGILLHQRNSDSTFTSRVSLLDLSSYGELGERFAYDEEITVSVRKGEGDLEVGFSDAGIRPWKDVRASIERAYFAVDLSRFHLQIGRDRKWWGSGRFGTLLLSTNAPPIDLIQFSTKIWRFRASAFTALISPENESYLSNHRLSLSLGRKTTIGLTEAVLYHRRLPELGYLNPIIPYYATQRNVNRDDNIFWHVNFSTFPVKRIKVYGELLIDDFQYADRDSFPDKLGGILGFQWFDPLGFRDTDLSGEVGRIQKWVYTQRDTLNTYLHEDAIIGDGLGPDAERILLLITHRWTKTLSSSIEGVSIRRGEGRDLVPWEKDRPPPHPPFPSGIVESRRSVGMGLDYEPSWWLRFSLLGRIVALRNIGNVEGDDSNDLQVQTGVEIDF